MDRRPKQRDRGLGERGRDEESVACALREGRESVRDERAQLGGYRKRVSRSERSAQLSQRAREFHREEGIAAGRLDDAAEDRPGESDADPREDDLVDRAEAERSDLYAPDSVVAQRVAEAERERIAASRPPGEKRPNLLGLDTAKRKFEQLRRGRVQPLHVVDRDDERAASAQRAQST